MEDFNHKLILESLIFAAPEPIDEKTILQIVDDLESDRIPALVDDLNAEYEETDRTFRIIRGAGGYRFVTQPGFSRWVKHLMTGAGRLKLSRPALETISIIAYRQPISRAEIENIRGVEVSGILRLLLERKLIQVAGRSPTSRRALLYGTTPEFLRHFGLESIDELPKVEELSEDMPHTATEQTDLTFEHNESAT